MHIADGLLSPAVCAGAGLLAAGAVGVSLRQLQNSLASRTVPLTGMLAALVFAGQMVNFPLLGANVSGHLLGGVLAAVILGPWAGCLALTVVLIVQCFLFADGGLTSLGANILNMGVVGSLGGYAVYATIRRRIVGSRGVIVAAVIASWVSVLAAAALFCLEFALSHPAESFDLTTVCLLMTAYHSVIGVGEALITGLVLGVVLAQRPDLIHMPEPGSGTIVRLGRVASAGVIVSLAIAIFLAPFASEHADGLEAVAAQTGLEQLAAEPRVFAMSDYSLLPPGVDASGGFWQKASVSLAGVVGTLVVFAIAAVLSKLTTSRLASTEGVHGP
jgi:cobalt/nickel transport system permease protein